MKKKNKIFLGGNYSGGAEIRSKIAESGKRIEKVINSCGYETSLNLLGNIEVHSHQAKAENVKFASTGDYFLTVGEKVVSSITDKKISEIKGLRSFKSQEEFAVCCMAANIALTELKKSIAGIFELSEKSQGSYMEIGLAVFKYEIPVLAISNESWGRPFSTMLTGLPSTLLKTVWYNDNNLEEIIKDFLTEYMPKKNLTIMSYRLPVGLQKKLRKVAQEKGFKSSSELMREIVEKFLEDY